MLILYLSEQEYKILILYLSEQEYKEIKDTFKNNLC